MARQVSAYIPLRCRTPYSILEGAIKIDDLAKRCREWRIPAVGLSDTNNICAALEFSEKLTDAGIQPIMGVTLSVDLENDDNFDQTRPHEKTYGKIALIAKNEVGYTNILKLSSAAFLDVDATCLPHVLVSKLVEHNEGIIALSGGYDGVANMFLRAGQADQANAYLQDLKTWFGDRFYIELQRHGRGDEAACEAALIDFAYKNGVPIVATNEPYFLDPDMHRAHDALLAISEGSYVLEPDRRHVTKGHYLKSPDDMIALFIDLPEAIENTIEIAKRCAFRSPKRKPILPNFGSKDRSEADILKDLAEAGLKARLKAAAPAAAEGEYFERLAFELNVINQMGFPGYFLIVADFIQWAKAQDIPVGPGRGSGAGSVVAWALTITDLDPLRYGLLFERFLNPERVSMPDFDIDFCQERRGEVIRYVQDKYGEDQVAHIITFGTLQARAVVRDVGRVLQMPLGQVDRLAKLVPSNPASPVSLNEAIKIEPALQRERDNERAVAELLTIALQLEGLYRNASTHAAGVVIGDRALTELVPLYRDPRSEIPATQFTMKWVEKAGLVKFDFLGLKTLTVIDRTLKYLRAQDIHVDMDTIPVNEPKAYKILEQGFSQGVFQLESSGMRDVLRKIAPDSIEELTAIISLYRPGPMKNIGDYIERKFGRTEITYPHPSLAEILEETYGIIIYQEQVMQIAQVLSGYSLGDADILRRAMGKKDKDEMARQKSRFIEGAEKNGVKGALASDIFELVNEFAGYGFNKSHAAAYAYISYRTAYLKALYPVEFIAASMSLDIANVEKLAQFVQEGKRMDIEFIAPCVNTSFADFEVRDGKILYALGAIKNVGLEAMRHLVEERENNGPFKDMFDFARRIDSRVVNKRAFENLSRAGTFETLEPNRARAYASASVLLSVSSRASEERNSAQVNLFGDTPDVMVEPNLPDVDTWIDTEKLDQELGAVGFYLSGHPLERCLENMGQKRITLYSATDNEYAAGARVARMAGVLHKKQERISQRTKKRFAYLNFSDPTGDFEVFIGEDTLNRLREKLVPGTVFKIQVKLELREGEMRFTGTVITPFDASGDENPKQVNYDVFIRTDDALEPLSKCLEEASAIKAEQKGKLKIVLPVTSKREVHFALPGLYNVDKAVLANLKSLPGVEKITEAAA